MKLNLGCGRDHIDGFINIDRVKLPSVDLVIDLDSRTAIGQLRKHNIKNVDEIYGEDFIEHISNPLQLMDALYRVAAPDCKCTFWLPYGSSDDAWEDPTHVRPYFLGSFGYFSQPYYWRADYGYRGDWRVETIQLILSPHIPRGTDKQVIAARLMTERNMVQRMGVVLRAVIPGRDPKRELMDTPEIVFTYQAEEPTDKESANAESRSGYLSLVPEDRT